MLLIIVQASKSDQGSQEFSSSAPLIRKTHTSVEVEPSFSR